MPFPPAILWLIALIVFCVLEGITPTALISIWFAVGSLAAMITSFFTENLIIQLAVFVLVSVLALGLVRPLVRKYFTPKTVRTNADRLIGESAIVTEKVDNLAGTGQVNLKGRTWTARAEDNTPIPSGVQVKVLRIEGVKVIVRTESPSH